MAKKPLSERAEILLALIVESTTFKGGVFGEGELATYFCPSPYPMWLECWGNRVDVGGSGDAAIIRGFIKRGLAKKQKLSEYSCSATEDASLLFEDGIRQKFEESNRANQSRINAEHDAEFGRT